MADANFQSFLNQFSSNLQDEEDVMDRVIPSDDDLDKLFPSSTMEVGDPLPETTQGTEFDVDAFFSDLPQGESQTRRAIVQPANVEPVDQQTGAMLSPDDPQYVDIMLPSLMESAGIPTAKQPVRPTRVEALAQENADIGGGYSELYDSLDEEGKKEFTENLREGLKGIDERTGKTTLTGQLMSGLVGGADWISGDLDIGTRALVNMIDALEYGGAAAVDGVQSTLEYLGEDSRTYKGINRLANGFGYALSDSPRELANTIADDFNVFLEFSDTLPVLGKPQAIATAIANRPIKKALGTIKSAERSAARAAFATREAIEESRVRAAQEAANNKDIAQDLIKAFQDKTGTIISRENKDGTLEVDYDLVRQVGNDTAEMLSNAQNIGFREFLEGDINVGASEFAHLATGGEKIVSPILDPEKFNGIVAVASDLKRKHPDVFDNNKTIIDNLFDLTVSGELGAGQDLVDDLAKYGLSFEDYVLTVVGSGSQAGKVLQKLSQIKRARPLSEMDAAQQRSLIENQDSILGLVDRKAVMRFENVRRGGLVSQLATAARNFESAAIRAPMEGLGNVMDTALLSMQTDGLLRGGAKLASPENWKDSFRHMSYMFSRPDIARDYTDLILNRPEFEEQFDRMFNSLGEIQELTGRGTGTVGDKVMSGLEDAVEVLNMPNRWQEFLIRRATFFAELERSVRNEYKTDLVDLLQAGKLPDLVKDVSSVKPEKARSFINLVDDAVTRSLDVTYAKQPEVPVFRSTANFITRNGLTTVIPFPRFMFNSMELMGQYAAGASIPATRAMIQLIHPGKKVTALTAKDRQRITRNLVGAAGVLAAYQYRTSEEAPADYKYASTGENSQLDLSPMFPMRQYMWAGEATKRIQDGTFSDWWDQREFIETFAGTNVRVGTGGMILDELITLADGTDLTAEERAGELLGGMVGQYLSTMVVPFAQLVEAQRATGERGLTYKDAAEDPVMDFSTSFMDNLKRPFIQRGFNTPEEEAALPEREFMFTDSRERVAPMARVIFGLNQSTKDKEYGEFLTDLGFSEYELSSRSDVPSVRRFEARVLRDQLPIIVDSVRAAENEFRNLYYSGSPELRKQVTEKAFVSTEMRKQIIKRVRDVRTKIADGKFSESPDYVSFMAKYRKLPPDERKSATNYFIREFGREPMTLEGSEAEDLAALIELAKATRAK